ncbi:S8 family peptidase [Bacillus mycoides]|uniref:S8 family peptidase n=1 Tax=Bacillus mycoides TaxID=1405 RepID=UPI003F7C3110
MYKKIICFIVLLSIIGVNNSVFAKSDVRNSTVLITFKEKIDKELIFKYKGEILESYENLPIVRVKISSNVIDDLALNDLIEGVEIDNNIKISNQGSDFKFSLSDHSLQTMSWGFEKIQVPSVHKYNITGKNVSVAIIDTGIDIYHEDLHVNGGISFLDYTTSYHDDNGHGTHIAGIVGALDNDKGIIGVAPDVDLYSVKALDKEGNGKYSNVIKGIDWAINNDIKIISMSINGIQESVSFEKATELAYKKGILLVSSAGNKGYFNENSIMIPAKYDSVISVGALDEENQRWEFSSRGKELELMAPGVDILSTFLNGSYIKDSGSSMAAAYVTGLAALIMEKNPLLSNQQVREILQNNAEKLGITNEYGYGLINAIQSINNIN